MKKISAEIVADSVNLCGDRITTMLLTYPRFIHGEVLTHRVFSKNSASSRAIPFEKMVEMVETDPFIPIAWQKDHKGMQGSDYITDQKIIDLKTGVWLKARDEVIHRAEELNGNLQRARSFFDIKELEDTGVTKQLCNRLLEPFMWHTVLLTGTEFENFFELRCPRYEIDLPISNDRNENWKTFKFKSKKDLKKEVYSDEIDNYNDLEWLGINKGHAEIHMMALAEAMWDAYNESIPKILQSGEWHIPFRDNMDEKELDKLMPEIQPASLNWYIEQLDKLKIKVATARCARLSYMTFDGEIDYEKDLKLHDTLLESQHMSPFEHCARAMNDEDYYTFRKGQLSINSKGVLYDDSDKDTLGWSRNFKGFISYRHLIES